MTCFFYAIARMRLAEAVLLNYSLPLFTPPIARLWLGERVPPGLGRALAVGFAGLLLILKPGLGLFQPVALVALAAALFAAVAQVGVRSLTRTEPVTRIVFYFGLVSTLVSAVPLLYAGDWPPPKLFGLLIGLGLCATLGQLLLTRAYSYAPAAQVGPFIYSSVVFAGLFDWIFWQALPDLWFVAGGVLVVVAGVLTLRARPAPLASET
jgi:drug/metabolite transporter (DMT)-like permease